MEKYIFTDDMGEINGFGGDYEASCRAMLKVCLDWWNTFPDADPRYYGFRNIYGICMDDNNDARDLDRAIISAAGGDCTGAMHQAQILLY